MSPSGRATNGTGRKSGNKGKRKESRGINTLKKLLKSQCGKLIVKFDKTTGKSVGSNCSNFNNYIHMAVRDLIPPTTFRWADVPRATIDLILQRLNVSLSNFLIGYLFQ